MDENFHHISGQVRYIYLKNLGDFDKYKKIYALDYYPGFNDTINYVLYKIILPNIHQINQKLLAQFDYQRHFDLF